MIPLHDRLPSGGLIDRDRRLRFFFNGKSYYGYEGDSLASALLANSVHLTGRSFKYHRPRGIQGYGYEEPATLVQLEGLEDAANWPVTRVPLYEGLRARSINCWPGPAFDLGGVAQAFAQLLPAGFYYKTFMWPDWHLFEPLIRKAAGLGQAPTREAKDLHYESRHHHCDVLVIGAGPAGLMAAMTAGAAGADVLLVDDDLRVGGRLLSETAEIDGEPAEHWLKGVEDRLRAMPSVQYLPQATAWAYHDHNLIMVTERAPAAPHVFQRTWRVRAKEVVLASGAIERPLVFENNDRPGVMLASAARGYAKRYGVRAGGKAVFFANNDSAWRAAFELAAAGVTVASIVDIRADVTPDLAQQAHEKDIDVHLDSHVATALGHKHIRGVKIGSQGNKTLKQVDCDLLCVSGGWNPAVHLFSQSRGSLKYHPSLTSFVPDQTAQRVRVAGSANGTFDLASCLRDGMAAGLEAGRAAGFEAGSLPLPNSTEGFSYGIEPHWGPQDQDSAGKKAFVDVQNDVTVADLDLAVREGFGAVEHAKRYTTTGMGIDQGKTGNINAIGILSGITGTELDQVGTTTFRPPYVPIEFGAVVGARPGPEILVYRHTPMTQWHKDQGAEMYEAGARWRRPGYYPKDDETWLQAAIREAEAVRNRLGVYDGSPLGKYVIKGPDALKLLELVYTNDWANLKPQRGRYGLMLTDDGLILDDGVTFKLGDDHYLMTTSTGHADSVYRHLEEILQVERPDWRVWVTPVTEQWANATVCGPLARDFMAVLGTDIDLAREAFPFMAMREGQVAGLPARVFRVSFTGELSYEINVPARQGAALWEKVMAAGSPFGITPVGSETSHLLRVEKGFLSLGHEVDGTADPYDLGLGWMISKKKPDFLGKRALEIRRAGGGARRELVGLLIDDPNDFVPEGSPITPGGRKERTEGFVSACTWSAASVRVVALGMLSNGGARHGERVFIRLKEQVIGATVTDPIFHDPAGERLRS